MNELALGLYLAVLAIGFFCAAISLRSPGLGLGLWLAAYPLTCNLVIPQSLEKLPPTRVAIALLLGTTIVHLWRHRYSKVVAVPVIAVVAFLGVSIVTAFYSPIGTKSLSRAATYVEPFAWLLVGIGTGISLARASAKSAPLWGAVIGFACVLAVAVPEFLLQVNPLLASGVSRNLGDYMIDRRLGFTGRLASTLGQPVFAGMYGVVALGVISCLMSIERRANLRLLLTYLAILAVAFVILTGTRGAIAGAVALPVVYLLVFRRRGAWKVAATYGTVAVLVLAVAPRALVSYWKDSVSLIEPSSSNSNVLGRIVLTRTMLQVFLQRPLLGAGSGYFQKAEGEDGTVDPTGLSGVENQYATLLAETGVIGTGILLAAFFFLIRALARVGPFGVEDQIARSWMGAILVALGIMGMSCFVLTGVPMLVAMSLVGAALGRQVYSERVAFTL